MKKSITPLGETEMEILNHIWDMEEATVKQILNKILKKRQVAYTTIMTVMKNLADKGLLTYRKEGVTYVYKAKQEPEAIRSNLVNNLVSKVFKNSPMQLVQTLVENDNLTENDLQEIKSLINKMETH